MMPLSTGGETDVLCSLIKGYLPVRIRFPNQLTCSNLQGDGAVSKSGNLRIVMNETFFFVKEHHGSSSMSNAIDTNVNESHKNTTSTLFIANAPLLPFIRTKLLLKSIFGRYAEVSRVTVIPNPLRSKININDLPSGKIFHSYDGEDDENIAQLQSWTQSYQCKPSFLKPHQQEDIGRFAHVVFNSNKDMKRALKSLHKLMTSNSFNMEFESSSEDDVISNLPPALTIDSIEIQTLVDETERQILEELGMGENDDNNDDFINQSENALDSHKKRKTGICSISKRYRDSIPDRDALLEECNAVMEQYEDEEAELERKRIEARNQPDEDGFITVTYSSLKPISDTNLEDGEQRGRGVSRRARKKKKKGIGTYQLTDFYRFQAKENRKKALHDLRSQFEHDVSVIKKRKEEKNTGSTFQGDST